MSAKRTILILLITFLSTPLPAQNGKKVFLGVNFKALKNEKRAAYYELREGVGKKRSFEGKTTTYTLDDKLLQVVFMKDGQKEGSYMRFNNEDFTPVKGQYISGNKIGSWFSLDANGDYIEEVTYSLSGDELERKDLSVDNEVYYEEVDVPAGYDKGNSAWASYVRKSIRYPPQLRAASITGKIEIHFRVAKNGEFNGYHVLESPHPLLTASIITVVLNSGKWQGAIKNNQLVNSIFIYRSAYNINNLKK